MDIATITVLANATISFLAPYLKLLSEGLTKKVGEKIGESTTETALDKTKQLYETVKLKFSKKPFAKEAIEDLENKPEDPDSQAVVRSQLKKLLAEDETFAGELSELLKQISESEKDFIFNTTIVGDSQNILQIANSTLTSGKDIIGRDRVEIHTQNINIKNLNGDEKSWLNARLKWVKDNKDLSTIENIAATMDDMPLYSQGRRLFENRNYIEAVIFWEELYRRHPENSEYESYLRLSLSKVAREEDIEKAVNSLIGMAQSLICLGSHQEAIRCLEQAIALSPNNQEVIRLLSSAWQAWEEKKNKMIEKRIAWARNALKENDFENAEKCIKDVFELAPYSQEAHELLNQIQNQSKNRG